MQAKSQKNTLQQIAELRQKYIAQLPEKWSAIMEKWQRWHVGERDSESGNQLLDELRALLHSLAGSGKTFGLPKVSELSRSFELSLQNYKQDQEIDLSSIEYITSQMSLLVNNFVPLSCAVDSDLDHSQAQDQGQGREQYILFALNDEKQSQLYSRLLEQLGYKVLRVSSNEQMGQTLAEQMVALAFVEIDLCDGNSAEFLQFYRKRNHIDTSFVFVASHGDVDTRLKTIRAGADSFLELPLDMSNLLQLLESRDRKNNRQPYRIMIIEDDGHLAEFYSLTLRSAGMETLQVLNAVDLLSNINNFMPDLILMDLYMPQHSGKDLAQVIRQEQRYSAIPIIYLSSESDLSVQLNAIYAGGDEFLVKPIKPKDLVNYVINRCERARSLSGLLRSDSLTGLLNHSSLQVELEREVKRAKRMNCPISVVMIDLDHFKKINDAYGHTAGDKVLKALSVMLRQRLRGTDIIARYGGEEFGLVLFDTNAENATEVVDRIRQAFASIEFHNGQHCFTASFSAGVASFPQLQNYKALFDSADQALYDAKEQGRNQVRIFDSGAQQ